MVVTKKGLCLGLLASLLCMGNVMQAYKKLGYKLIIENKTPFKVKFEVNYLGEVESLKSCRSDKGELTSGKRKVIRSGLCLVTAVGADVIEVRRRDTAAGIRGSLRGVIKAKPYRASWGRAGNTTWLIEGPFYDANGRTEYTVTRKKN